MKTLAYDGYFKGGRFFSSGKTIQIPEERRVVITILEDVQTAPPIAATSSQKDVAMNFLKAMKTIRKDGLTAEENKSIDEFQSGEYKIQFEERL